MADVAPTAKQKYSSHYTFSSMEDINFEVGIGTGTIGAGGQQNVSAAQRKVYMPMARK